MSRMRAFLFLLSRENELLEVTFYAVNEQRALEAVTQWATKRGWTVEGSE